MNNTYFDNKCKKTCNGCGACALVCPKKCIKMVEDSEGFLYPEIDESECIKCNNCKRMCSNFPKYNEFSIKAYAAKNKDDEQRNRSTSGGMFKILAEYVIENKGVVFGVKFSENLIVMHDYAENIEDCKQFSFSKYVRSDLNNSYEKVKEFLKMGRYVLFSGTPCQIQGLRNYIGKDNEKLILCEIICHANPSPKVFKMYIKNIEKNTGKKVKTIYFRSKNPEMKNSAYFEMEDGTKVSDSLYNYAFSSKQLINRPSCYNCQFVSENRKADFTIGDFWGVDKLFSDFNDGKGVSLITVNSSKAVSVFDNIKDKMIYQEVELIKAFENNHHINVKVNPKREKFFIKLTNEEINEDNILKYMKKYLKKSLGRKVLGKIKKCMRKIGL